MAFRAGEAAERNYEEAERYLVPRPQYADERQRRLAREMVRELVDELGPVVDTYPSWHPLVRNHDARHPETVPSTRCGYKGLDHTRHFAHGFITCPYVDGQSVIDSVESLPWSNVAKITAERLDVKLYNPDTDPILVRCEWNEPLPLDKTIPISIAMPLLLERELPMWHWSEVAETWESMRHYFLGSPHGARSSLFVSQDSGQKMKKIWVALIATGMYGPIKVG